MILKPLTNLRTLSGAALRTYLKFTGSVPTEKRGGPNIVSYLIVKGLLSLGLRDVKLHRLFRRMSEEYAPACFAKGRSEEHTSELQSRGHLVCRLLLEDK